MLFPSSWFGRGKESGSKGPIVKAPPPSQNLAGPQHSVAVGRNQLGSILKTGQAQSALDLESLLEQELPELSLQSPSSEDSTESSNDESTPSPRSARSYSDSSHSPSRILPKKTVTFNDKIDIRVFERVKGPESPKVTHTARSLDAHMQMDRNRAWCLKHWAEVISSAGAKEGARGGKRMHALLQKLEDSVLVARAREIFAEASSLSAAGTRNPMSELALAPGLVFDPEDLVELERGLLKLKDLWHDLKPERFQLQKQVNLLKINTRPAMSEASDTASAYEQRVLRPINVSDSDDPAHHTVPRDTSTCLSLDGNETTVARSLAPVLMWGEFLAAMDYAEGTHPREVPQNIQVVVLSRPA